MSRAHVRETDGDEPEDLPELPLSAQPNYVTPRGLALLRRRHAEGAQALARLPPDAADLRQRRAQIERELRWLAARIASAQAVDTLGRKADRVAFGALVAVLDEDGGESRYRIVGEDEAEPEAGRISWTSPLARALIGARLGERVTWERPAGAVDIEVAAIDYTPEPAD
jgi:transcription elongation GreA/GreB family factor